jgi:hypothetical protein
LLRRKERVEEAFEVRSADAWAIVLDDELDLGGEYEGRETKSARIAERLEGIDDQAQENLSKLARQTLYLRNRTVVANHGNTVRLLSAGDAQCAFEQLARVGVLERRVAGPRGMQEESSDTLLGGLGP